MKNFNLNNFNGKKILVTGSTGFKGSWLSLWLYNLGAEVFGYALPAQSDDAHFNLLNLKNKIIQIENDIVDYKYLLEKIKKFKPEIIFHLAAQALVHQSYKDPLTTYKTNIIGSANILQAALEVNTVKAIVFVTSDKCYLNKEWIWGYRENDELGGVDPYSASKAACEIIFSSYMKSFFVQNNNFGAASVRAGNIIGGGDISDNRIISDCMRALLQKENLIIRNPNATRPWQHVLEPIYGYLILALSLLKNPKKYSGSWNFGPTHNSVYTVKDIANKIISNWGGGKLEIKKNQNKLHEAKLLQLICDKAKQKLNWQTRLTIDETIYFITNWYREIYFEKKNPFMVSSEQIKKYMEIISFNRF